ncbi:hypothetical protein [Streptomyces sp. NBC_00582]|uniref:hypothetical protein n=1 Tax=Streptomyces sp. NBC_00582 TaxID=2975783 RepID=UPI002E818AE5|nr:hypothetical protein [Streptomyces sp. NBC_00582]WUB66895.1 hypothetical protein OG852_44090 [Streptomyces sp. NBC_00582]
MGSAVAVAASGPVVSGRPHGSPAVLRYGVPLRPVGGGQPGHPGQADDRRRQDAAEQRAEEQPGVAEGEGGRAQGGQCGDGRVKAMVRPVAVERSRVGKSSWVQTL